jgi:type II secretory pathway pseudopilin PulG
MMQKRTTRRPAFTMVEILVVLLIIATLIALLLSGLTSALRFGQVTAARSEISQLDVAIAAARRDLGYGGIDLPYLPSALVLCDTWSNYSWTSATAPAGTSTDIINLLAPSQQFLQKMFGKNIGSGTNPVNGANVDWNGNGVADPPVLLLGDQVLWFYLGGVPSTSSSGLNNYLGFASNPVDPTLQPGTTGAGNRKGPYFDFVPNRLVKRTAGFLLANGTISTTSTSPTPANAYFPLYLDFYKQQPYIYLSAYGGLGYNNWITTYCVPPYSGAFNGNQLNNDINQFQNYGLVSQYVNPGTQVGGSISSVTATNNYTATIATSSAHGLSVGNLVNIGGAQFHYTSQVIMGTVNGTWVVSSVPSSTTFTIIADTQNLGSYTGGGAAALVTTAINPNTYQIISAGSDGNFGAGGTWNSSTGYPATAPPNAGADDIANFSRAALGKPAN